MASVDDLRIVPKKGFWYEYYIKGASRERLGLGAAALLYSSPGIFIAHDDEELEFCTERWAQVGFGTWQCQQRCPQPSPAHWRAHGVC